MTLPVAQAAPGLFTADASGHGQAAALNQNLQANSAANPAAQGSLLSLFATGAGQMSPSATDGALNGVSPPSTPVLQPVAVTIGGQAATVSAAIGVPGQVAGIAEGQWTVTADFEGQIMKRGTGNRELGAGSGERS